MPSPNPRACSMSSMLAARGSPHREERHPHRHCWKYVPSLLAPDICMSWSAWPLR